MYSSFTAKFLAIIVLVVSLSISIALCYADGASMTVRDGAFAASLALGLLLYTAIMIPYNDGTNNGGEHAEV